MQNQLPTQNPAAAEAVSQTDGSAINEAAVSKLSQSPTAHDQVTAPPPLSATSIPSTVTVVEARSVEQSAASTSQPVPSDNLTIDGVSALAAVIIAAFAVDRFAAAITGMLNLIPAYRRCCLEPHGWAEPRAVTATPATSPDDATAETSSDSPRSDRRLAELRGRVVYFFVAACGAGVVVWIGQIGILSALGFKEALSSETHRLFDFFLTALILTAGADRVSAVLQLSGVSVGAATEPKPIEITGTLILDGQKEEFRAKIAEASGEVD